MSTALLPSSIGRTIKPKPAATTTTAGGGFLGSVGGSPTAAAQAPAPIAPASRSYGPPATASGPVVVGGGASAGGGSAGGAFDALLKMMAQQQAPAAAPASTPAPQLNLNATADPNMAAYLASLKARTEKLEAGEGAPVKASAERATNLVNRDIADAAAGARKRKKEELAARGLRTDVGAGAGELRAIEEGARTRSARAGSDIALAREKEQDALDLQRQGATNALYGQLGGASQVPFQQQLGAQNLALNAWSQADQSAIQRANLARQGQQSQMDTWLSLMRALG